MPIFIYFLLYLVIIDFHGLVWSPGMRSPKKQMLIFIFWFETVSKDK